MKTQLNFRIEEELLEKIKEAALSNGKTHTEWIINCCEERLGIKELSAEEIIKRLEQLEKRIAELEGQRKEEKTPELETTQSDHVSEELTNAQLAKKIGVDPSTVSRWITGKRKIPEDLKYKFDQTLKLWVKCDY
jgi:transcriptional regulator with XRE-family HTH domain